MPCPAGKRPVSSLPLWGRSPGREGPFLHLLRLTDIHTVIPCAAPGQVRRLMKGAYSVASAVLNIAAEGSLSRYLQEMRKFPMLTPEEELTLAHKWRDTQDMDAAHKLVTSHLRLVAKIAMGYRG